MDWAAVQTSGALSDVILDMNALSGQITLAADRIDTIDNTLTTVGINVDSISGTLGLHSEKLDQISGTVTGVTQEMNAQEGR
jgi:hypothetical protein